jgi:predicted  nucleic acid-binding Zn-ribbon protein
LNGEEMTANTSAPAELQLHRARRRLSLAREFLRAIRDKDQPERALTSFRNAEDAYRQGEVDPGTWQRLLFIALNALEGMEAESQHQLFTLTQKHCFELLDDDDLRASTLQGLLDFLFSSYTDKAEGIKGLLVEQLNHEIRLNRSGERHEVASLLSHQRRVFELPYPERQTDIVVGTITQLRGHEQLVSERIQHNLACRWLIDGQELHVPLAARRAIRDRLSQEDFQSLDDIFVSTVYRSVSTDIEAELEQILSVLTTWFPSLDVRDEERRAELRNFFWEYSTRSEARDVDPSCVEFKIMVANSWVLESLFTQLEKWIPHPRIPQKTLQLCQYLPRARERANALIKLVQEHREAGYLLPDLITLFQAVISGLSREIPGIESIEEDSAIRRIARLRERVLAQGADYDAIQFLYRVLSDISYPDDIRLRAVRALIHIFPEDLGVRLGQYVEEHPPEDVAMPHVLKGIGDKKLVQSWPALSRALAAWARTHPDFTVGLIEAAGGIGDPGILEVLIPLAFDHENEPVRTAAQAAIRNAGYDLSLRLEKLRRDLVALDREIRETKEKRHKRFVRSTELEVEFMELQRQITWNLVNATELQQALDMTAVDYHIDYTDIHIQLADIDNHVRALIERIKQLTKRKVALELELAGIRRDRDALRDRLNVLNSRISREKTRQRQLKASIRHSTERARELESEIELTTQRYRQERRDLASLEAAESRTQSRIRNESSRLHAQHNGLESNLRALQSDLRTAQSRYNSNVDRYNHWAGQASSLDRRISMVESDSEERRLRAEMQDVRSTLSSINLQLEQDDREMKSLQNQISSIGGQLRSIESQHRRLENELSASSNRVQNAQMRVLEMETRLSSLELSLSSIQSDIANLRNQVSQSEQEVGGLQREAAKLEDQISKLEAEARRLEERLTPVIRDLQAAERELERWRAEKVRVEQEAASAKQRYHAQFRQHDSSLSDTFKKIKGFNKDVDHTARNLKQIYEEIHGYDEVINQLNTRITDLREEFEHVNALDATQIEEMRRRHAEESFHIRLEHDQQEQNRLAYVYQLGQACKTLTTVEPDWMGRRLVTLPGRRIRTPQLQQERA